MQALIVYDSLYGNTEQIARAIASGLTAMGEVRVARVSDVSPSEIPGAKLVIIGSPTQGGRPTKAMQEFIAGIPGDALKGAKVAAFDTRISTKLVGVFGYAAGRIGGNLNKKGGTLVESPEGFFVKSTKGPLKDGELERAAKWAESLVNLV